MVKTLHIHSRSHMSCGMAKKKKKKKIKKVEPGDGEIPDAIIEVPETKSISELFFLPSFFFFFPLSSVCFSLSLWP